MIRERVVSGVYANGFAQVVTVLIQLLSVPVFLTAWGLETYGEWLILFAIPSYLALTDLGFPTAAANIMTMSVARGDRNEALSVFQTAWCLFTGVSTVLLLIIAFVAWISPLEVWLNLTRLSHVEVVAVVVLLCGYVLIGLQAGFLTAVFRCEGKYAIGATLFTLLRLSEFAAAAIAVNAGGGPVFVASSYLMAKIVGFVVVRRVLARQISWIVYGLKHARAPVARSLFKPAMGFLAMPIANALNLQGMVTVIGAILGPSSVVVFSTLRTLSRLAFQAMVVVANAVWPEISRAFGKGDLHATRFLHKKASQISLWLALILAVCLSLLGPAILRVWTGGDVPMDKFLYESLLLVVVVDAVWYPSSVTLLAINSHQRIAWYNLTLTIAMVSLAVPMLSAFGLKGAAAPLLVTGAVMSATVIRTSLSVLKLNLSDYLKAIVIPPVTLLQVALSKRGV